MDLKSLRKLYLNSKRHESDPVYAKHLVLYFFRRLLIADRDCDDVMRRNPKLLVKCLFGLIQVHLEYGSYFSLDDLSQLMLVAEMGSFEQQLVSQWLGVYVSEWSDEYDLIDSGLLHELVTSRFPLQLFGCNDSHEFMNKYVHLVFQHFLNEFDRLPRSLSSNEE